MNRPDAKLRTSPHLDGLRAYAVPRAPAPVDLKLDSNEGVSPPHSLLKMLLDAPPETMSRYNGAGDLESLIAEQLDITPDRIIVTAGGDEAIDRACRVYVAPDREVVVPVPTFEMCVTFARLSGGQIRKTPWPDGPFPVDAVLDQVTERTGMIVLISPNNPTGLLIQPHELEALAAAAPHVLLMVDLAYAPFAEVDLTPTVLRLPNALAVHTLSKGWGMAGLRVGYAVGAPEVIANLRVAGGPYPVSNLSLLLARTWLSEGRDEAARTVALIKDERETLRALLSELGARAYPTQGNFAFAHVDDPLWLRDAMAGMGIGIRYMPPDEGFAAGVRITCPGNDHDFARLTHALRTAMAPQALLFDLDGVLTADLFDADCLARLAKRLPLAVVTGRDRADAEAFLRERNIADLFSAVVGGDDAKAKPDPEPLQRALSQLGVERGWLIGDEPDDMRAARAARVLGLGFSADASPAMTDALHEAGAARVLSALAQLEDLL